MEYFINAGSFDENKKGQIVFNGGRENHINKYTQKEESINLYGELFFKNLFKEGRISFSVFFDEICDTSEVGVVFNYRNVNNNISFYRAIANNTFGGYGIYKYDFNGWKTLASNGNSRLKEKKKYKFSLDLKGNKISLMINDICLLEYYNFINDFTGICGIYISNCGKATISDYEVISAKPSVFCIMKFEEDFNILYRDVIAPQCDRFGLKAVRADECYASTPIINDIVKEIMDASIIITDVTMDNANVFYELGYAHALNKPTILLADIDKRDKLPFDISGFRTIFYKNTIGGKKEVEEKLSKYIENIIIH